MLINRIDFSCKHDVLIRNEDGLLLPMDTPYFESACIAPGTWRIHSDGDSFYLVEGDDEAIVIDSGYGAGNVREYCQSLTQKPIHNIINTHDHFDHTANNAYFDKAYMTKETQALATIPFPSFEGIDFPRDYPVEIVKEGDKLDLGGRTLEVIEIPDHACGSIALLDSRERILFSGDEVIGFFKKINGTIDKVLEQMKKLRDRNSEFDIIWPGPGDSCSPQIIDRYIETLEYLKAGGVGEPGFGLNFPQKEPQPESQPIEGKTIYDRFKARPCDQKVQNQSPDEEIYHINKFGILVIYDKAKL